MLSQILGSQRLRAAAPVKSPNESEIVIAELVIKEPSPLPYCGILAIIAERQYKIIQAVRGFERGSILTVYILCPEFHAPEEIGRYYILYLSPIESTTCDGSRPYSYLPDAYCAAKTTIWLGQIG